MRALVLIAIASAVAAGPRLARACSIAANPPYVADPALRGVDTLPPAAPVAGEISFRRANSTASVGCVMVSTCDDIGFIDVSLALADDHAKAEAIGVKLSLASGILPVGVNLPTEPILLRNGAFELVWVDTDPTSNIQFELDVVAIDTAGNESAPTRVQVTDTVPLGCRQTGLAPLWPLAGAVLALRRRRAVNG